MKCKISVLIQGRFLLLGIFDAKEREKGKENLFRKNADSINARKVKLLNSCVHVYAVFRCHALLRYASLNDFQKKQQLTRKTFYLEKLEPICPWNHIVSVWSMIMANAFNENWWQIWLRWQTAERARTQPAWFISEVPRKSRHSSFGISVKTRKLTCEVGN